MKSLTRKRRRKVHRQMMRQEYSIEIKCWCGEPNPYFHPQRGGCGGHRFLICRCGGDLCVCHNHGEIECFGCPDCDGDDDDAEVMGGNYLEEEYQ